MKKFLALFVISFTLSVLLISFITYANQTTMSNYYPSPSGAYTKIQLRNQNGNGPDAYSANNPFCLQTSSGYDAVPTAGHTYINAGVIFADPNSGYLETCKSDGSVASYPGASFSRFCTGANCASAVGACPPNYTAVANPGSIFSGVTSYSCAFTNTNTTKYAKAGCFSNFSSANSPSLPAAPTSCASVDRNAYDMGCQTITTATTATYKRDCCFNIGPNALGVTSVCSTPSSCATCANYCGPITTCGETLSCGICQPGFSCDVNTQTCVPQPCASSGPGSVYHSNIPGVPSGSLTIPSCPNSAPHCQSTTGTCDNYYHNSPSAPVFSCYATVITLLSGSCALNQCAAGAAPPANSVPCPNSACYYAGAIPSSPFATSYPPSANTTPWTLVNGSGSCSTSDCQVYCPSGYTVSGGLCRINTCGTLPANSTACPNTPPPVIDGTAYTLVGSCGNTACSAYCNANNTNGAASGSYTTAGVILNSTNVQNGIFCTLSGSTITSVSDGCQGTNSAGIACHPTFNIQSTGCYPSSIPDTLSCADTGQSGCGSYQPCRSRACGVYGNQCC